MNCMLTTQQQEGYRQLIEKEARTRLAWKLRYGSQFPSKLDTHRDHRGPLFYSTVLPPVAKASPVKQELQPKREVQPKPKPQMPDVLMMRPVSPATRQVLYEGLSNEGRDRYLRIRQRKAPEEKFEYPELSSWDYGWRLGSYGVEYKSPKKAHSCVMRNTFYARTGIFHIPSPTDQLA